jgi:hypothetical protein
MKPKRQAIHAYLSQEAHEAWGDFAAANGVSLTSLIEALGRELMEEPTEAGPDRIDWIRVARSIDAKNRLRGGAARKYQ